MLQQVTTGLHISVMWSDPRLMFKGTKHDRVTFTDTTPFWTPDPHFVNGYDHQSDSALSPKKSISIDYLGNVTLSVK